MDNTTPVGIGIDIGGTFTDIVAVAGSSVVGCEKTPSTPHDYSEAIGSGLQRLLERHGISPDRVGAVTHATTIATNAILEGKGAKTGLLTTLGFRDVLELQRIRIPELYNLNFQKPLPLVPRSRRLEVAERVGHDGSILRLLDRESLSRALEALAADEIEALAICFLHSYVNPDHEEIAAERAREILGKDVYISTSSAVLPEIREYERCSTTVINAYVGPTVSNYVRRIRGVLDAIGIQSPLRIMQSSGGILSAEAVLVLPAAIVESGPAAGVIGAQGIAMDLPGQSAITIDMGGTTAKASLIENGQLTRTSEYEVGAGINVSSMLVKGRGHALRLPVIDISEIGAGGGSIARIDGSGRLHVGPDSAGSVPGPVAYGRGGTKPTLTDAMVVLGYINPTAIAGGDVPIDFDGAAKAIDTKVAAPAGLERDQAAYGIYELSAAIMTRAVKAVTTLRGRDPRQFGLVAFGGNGALMAAKIAENLDVTRIIVPPLPGLFSAAGLMTAQEQREAVQSHFRRLDASIEDELKELAQRLTKRVLAQLVGDEAAHVTESVVTVSADLRYAGQAYELTVDVDLDAPSLLVDRIAAAFHAEHARSYGHSSPGEPVDLVSLRALASDAAGTRPLPIVLEPAASEADTAPQVTRMVGFDPKHGRVETPVLTRRSLRAAKDGLIGPLVIEEYDATVLVPPGWRASVDTRGNILLEC